ncbi:MAG: AraC family transcriptional regulator [Clostridiaceae bacterium]|jgi:AraC-like DNA-binding protein|nr:AraC family transcriptional regulator [Eubacteriales bacterium]NLV48966.1 AraC family transcriptional regulator [Clostridiaceae bacterium]
MFEDLLPAVEKGIMDAAGSIPVVFKGMERSFERSATMTHPSRHDYHELTYVRSGKADFLIDGRHVSVEKGATLVIRPNTSHQIKIRNGPAEMLVLYFGFSRQINRTGLPEERPVWTTEIAPQTLEQFIDFAFGNDAGASDKSDEPYLLLGGKSRQDIAALIERILRESRKEAYGRELMMQLLAMELLVVLARGLREEWEESLRVRTGKARELVRIARNYIVENHDRDLSIAHVAAYVFLSQGYFTRAFRDETGISPMSFLMQVRVDHACKLLERQDIKVSGIARQVGFSSPQRFNAAFRKHMGMTPMQYRRTILEQKGTTS